MNIFDNAEEAANYDAYYKADFGKRVDEIEKRVMSSLIKDIPRVRMLELGCGTGHWTKYFAEQGFRVTAVDISEPMLWFARDKKINAEFLQGDAHRLQFKDKSYSVVASVTMLEFTDDQEKVLDEIYRILKPMGWLILGCLNEKSVLGQNKESNETFKKANFINPEKLISKLERFGRPILKYGVCLNHDGTFFDDNADKKKYAEPVFIAAIVQKLK